MKTEDGKDVHIDLLGVFGSFRFECGILARNREWLEQHAKSPTAKNFPDARFEEELERLIRFTRAWWEDYKNEWWRTIVPGPPDTRTSPIR